MAEFGRSEQVAAIFASDTDHKAQFEALTLLCSNYLPENAHQGVTNVAEVLKITDTVIALETGSMVVSRQFLGLLTDRLENGNGILSSNTIKGLAEGILSIIKTRTISYEEQVCSLRLLLAHQYEVEGRVRDAANTLIAINSDTSPKFNAPNAAKEGSKAQLCHRISKLLIACNEVDEAEQFVNRASLLMVDVQNQEIVVEHKALQAQVCDMKQRFVESAQKFYELSLSDIVLKSDRIEALRKAIISVILAKPGIQRNRILNLLFKDDRVMNIPFHELVCKMNQNRIIQNEDLKEFEAQLQPHQKVDEEGKSIIRSVIQEHNITAISQLYINISMKTLGLLLGMDADSAELMSGEMIASQRLNGYIDQADGILHFEDQNQLRMWDSEIQSTLEQINKVSEMIVSKHPILGENLENLDL